MRGKQDLAELSVRYQMLHRPEVIAVARHEHGLLHPGGVVHVAHHLENDIDIHVALLLPLHLHAVLSEHEDVSALLEPHVHALAAVIERAHEEIRVHDMVLLAQVHAQPPHVYVPWLVRPVGGHVQVLVVYVGVIAVYVLFAREHFNLFL